MDKTIRWNPDPEAQKDETYRYWQNVSIEERFKATVELSLLLYNLKQNVVATQNACGTSVTS